jgi:hypothetical protein
MATDIADFVAFERVNGHHAEGQSMDPAEDLKLLGDAISDKIENSRLGKVFGERPGISLAGKVSAAAIAQDYVNCVPVAHIKM